MTSKDVEGSAALMAFRVRLDEADTVEDDIHSWQWVNR